LISLGSTSASPSLYAPNFLSSISRGGDSSYSIVCESVKSEILTNANKKIEEIRRKVVDEGTIVPSYGQVCDEICSKALEEFALKAAGESDQSQIYDENLQQLEAALDAPLQVLYLRQLVIMREKALQMYRATARSSETSDFEAMLKADSQFASEAEEATREGSDWDFAADRSQLQSILNDMASTQKKLMDVQIKSSEKQSTAMAFLQQQQQMIQQLQMQLYGQTSPWNMGVAYRIPDTNFNLQGSYQQGRTNLQLSCLPDEYAPMLGANGFTNGVGPGNLGLSLNLSV